jgi:hypothetical protein
MGSRREGPALGIAGGCALTAVLLGVAMFALIGFVIVTGIFLVHRAVQSNPIEHLRVITSESTQSGKGVQLSAEFRGNFAAHIDEQQVRELLRELDIEVSGVEVKRWEDGVHQRTRVVISFPFDFHRRDNLPRVERRLREAFDSSQDRHEDVEEKLEFKDIPREPREAPREY